MLLNRSQHKFLREFLGEPLLACESEDVGPQFVVDFDMHGGGSIGVLYDRDSIVSHFNTDTRQYRPMLFRPVGVANVPFRGSITIAGKISESFLM